MSDKNNPENNDHMPDSEPIDDAALRGNADFDSDQDASEWRTAPYAKNLTTRETTQFADTTHTLGDVPQPSRIPAIERRRAYADAHVIDAPEMVQELGNRRYGAFSVTCPPGSGGYVGEPVMLLGADRSRVRLVISQNNTSQIWIGPRDQVAHGQGLFLPSGVLFESNVTEPIYAAVPVEAINPIVVGVWAEYA